ncbi:MAG: IS1182 family transposase [Dehalococcoidia bacterium]|nr:IS1182 family transposase [Dehalococcoidia bacterium]
MPLREMGREQIWLLPPTLGELVPDDHPARFVAEFVDALDREEWAELGVEINGDHLGAPAYHPRALLSVWLYGFMNNVRSCRKLEAACRDQIPLLWLTGWQYPDHNTLWRFYKAHRQAMRSLFRRTVRTAVAMELVDLAVQAVDGTKVIANASREKSYAPDQLERLLERVEKAIEEMEAQNEGGDEAVPARLPEQLADQKALRERVRQAVEEQASRKRPPSRFAGQNRINLTDRDAKPMKTREGFMPAYNAQAMVSPLASGGNTTGMLLTAVDVVDETNDAFQLTPMMEQAEEVTGTRTPVTLADAGYFGSKHLEASRRKGQQVAMPDTTASLGTPYHKDQFHYDEKSDSYTCPHGERMPFVGVAKNKGTPMRVYRVASGTVCLNCPAFGACTTEYRLGRALQIGPYDHALREHRAWMSTPAAQEAYQLRKQLVEPVFGIFKEQLGARRFWLRGLANVKAEWVMLATAFNLRTLWRAWRARADIPLASV